MSGLPELLRDNSASPKRMLLREFVRRIDDELVSVIGLLSEADLARAVAGHAKIARRSVRLRKVAASNAPHRADQKYRRFRERWGVGPPVRLLLSVTGRPVTRARVKP